MPPPASQPFNEHHHFFDEGNGVMGPRVLCMVFKCNKVSRARGLCRTHGGGRKCKVEGCEKRDQKRGLCAKHGGVDRCNVQDCTNVARVAQRCNEHNNSSSKREG